MGGVISLYALCRYPKLFGGAACLSTHWPGTFNMDNNPIPAAFMNYLRTHLPSPATHKIYFDYGDATLDALYPPLQKMADEVMKEKGFTSRNWMTTTSVVCTIRTTPSPVSMRTPRRKKPMSRWRIDAKVSMVDGACEG